MIPVVSPSLYDILGVPRDANPKAIRAAYFRTAKVHHPDKGGDPAEFHRIQLAFDILSDPERRAKYDATGDQSEQQPDNEQAEIVGMMMGAINDVVSHPIPFGSCVIAMACEQLRAQAEVGSQANDGLIKKRGGLERVLARLTHKAEGPNYIANAISEQIDGLTRNIAGNDRLIVRMGRAADMLRDGWQYERETMPATAAQPGWTFT